MDSKEKKTPYSHPRWTEVPVPEVIGTIEMTEEQKKNGRETLERLINARHGVDGKK